MRKQIFFLLLIGSGVTFVVPAWAEKPLQVVATTSTFADLVEQIGGDRVRVSYVASPKFNPHFIDPRPSDVLKVKKADLFVHSGLDLEVWRWPLVDAAGNPDVRPGGERELSLSEGVRLLEVPSGPVSRSEGDIHLYGNPHYWLDPENGGIMARTIAWKLSRIDPKHASVYRQRLKVFLEALDQAIQQWQEAASRTQGKEAVAYHNQWVYLTEFLGLKVEEFLEPKPGIPPTPQQILLVERHILEKKIPAILQASFSPKAASRQLNKKTGVQTVTLCQNVGESPECGNYLALIRHNIDQILKSIGGEDLGVQHD